MCRLAVCTVLLRTIRERVREQNCLPLLIYSLKLSSQTRVASKQDSITESKNPEKSRRCVGLSGTTDSEYVIKGMIEWLPERKVSSLRLGGSCRSSLLLTEDTQCNGFKTSSGSRAANIDEELRKKMKITSRKQVDRERRLGEHRKQEMWRQEQEKPASEMETKEVDARKREDAERNQTVQQMIDRVKDGSPYRQASPLCGEDGVSSSLDDHTLLLNGQVHIHSSRAMYSLRSRLKIYRS